MKLYIWTCFLAAAVLVAECGHTFMGNNVRRPMVYHHSAAFAAKSYQERVENVHFKMPVISSNPGRTIQGILAYDLTNSVASANVTQGGIGYKYVSLRMKSARGKKIHYDVYIYA